MMSVSEYASDVGKNVKDILNLCKKLELSVSSEDDMLDDEAIILLDNELDSIEDEVEEFEEEMEDFDDSYEEELEEVQVVATVKKKNKPQPRQENKKSDYKEKRKEMYKHKEKLQSNLSNNDDDNIVLYTDGMTVSEFASVLGATPTEVIKKLMGLGMMMNINASIDFDTAGEFKNIYSSEVAEISGTHDLYFVFSDKNISFRGWTFAEPSGDEPTSEPTEDTTEPTDEPHIVKGDVNAEDGAEIEFGITGWFGSEGRYPSRFPDEIPTNSLVGRLLSYDDEIANAAFAELTEKLSK